MNETRFEISIGNAMFSKNATMNESSYTSHDWANNNSNIKEKDILHDSDEHHPHSVILFGDVVMMGYVPLWATIVYIIINILVFLFGVAGNVIIVIIYRQVQPKMPCDWFILFIACMDIIVCIFHPVLNLRIEMELYTVLDFHGYLCAFQTLVDFSAIMSSSFILSLMAFERYIKVCRPSLAFLTGKRAKLTCYGIMGLSPLLCIFPCYLLIVKSECAVLWTEIPLPYLMFILSIFCVCFIIVTFSYANVIRTIELKIKVKQRLLSNNGLRDNANKTELQKEQRDDGNEGENVDDNGDNAHHNDKDDVFKKTKNRTNYFDYFANIWPFNKNSKHLCKTSGESQTDKTDDYQTKSEKLDVAVEETEGEEKVNLKIGRNLGTKEESGSESHMRSLLSSHDDSAVCERDLTVINHEGIGPCSPLITSPVTEEVLPNSKSLMEPSGPNPSCSKINAYNSSNILISVQDCDQNIQQDSEQTDATALTQGVINIGNDVPVTENDVAITGNEVPLRDKDVPVQRPAEPVTKTDRLKPNRPQSLIIEESDFVDDDDLYSDVQPVSFFLRRAKEKMQDIQGKLSRKKNCCISSSTLRRNKWMKERRMTLMLFSVTFIFLISWIPPWVLCLSLQWNYQLFESHTMVRIAYRYWEKITLLQYSTNCIIYYLFNPAFRKKANRLFANFGKIVCCTKSESLDLDNGQGL